MLLLLRRSAPYRYACNAGECSAKASIASRQRAAARDAVAGEEIVRRAARLGDEQDAGGAVPGIDVELAIRFDTSGRHVGQPERTRARATHRTARVHDALHQLDIRCR